MTKKYHIKKLYKENEIIEKVCVITNNEKIIGFDKDLYDPKLAFEIMIPGFIDLQIYGALNSLLMVESDYLTIKKINTHNTKNGTFYFQPTIASESNSTILKAIDGVKNYFSKGGKGCIGLHVEGPWINPLKKGAHSLKYIHSPEFDEVKKIIDYADGVISMITIAPEVVSYQIIEFLIKKGIVISIGHSALDFKSANYYFNKGINTCTHLFNAMPQIHHREPGLIEAIFNEANVFSSIICDGYHVDFNMIKLAHKIKKNKLFCITDAVTESNKGEYVHKLEGEIYKNKGVLSGSSITMLQSFKNLIQKVGLSVSDAVKMCCYTPSKVISPKIKINQLEINSYCTFNILDENYNLIK